jgi:hypothetical protein
MLLHAYASLPPEVIAIIGISNAPLINFFLRVPFAL